MQISLFESYFPADAGLHEKAYCEKKEKTFALRGQQHMLFMLVVLCYTSVHMMLGSKGNRADACIRFCDVLTRKTRNSDRKS